jgi:hypothetical protein
MIGGGLELRSLAAAVRRHQDRFHGADGADAPRGRTFLDKDEAGY